MASSTTNRIFKTIFRISFFSIGITTLCAQNNTASLKQEFLNARNDTTKVQLLFNMGNQFLEGPSDSLIYYYRQALILIDKYLGQNPEVLKHENDELILAYRRFNFRALNEIGIEKFFQGEYTESIEYAEKALKIAEVIEDKGLISECCGAIGIVYKNQGKYPEALLYYQRALDLAIELNDTAWIAACYANAGNVYRRLGNYTKALDYLLKAYEVFEKSKEKRRMAIGLMNIGNLFEDQKDYTRALEQYLKALDISYETNDNKRIAECLLNVGNIYLEQKNYVTARVYYEKSLKIHQEQGFAHTLDDCFMNIANAYEKEGNYSEALEYYNKAFELAKKEDDKGTLSAVQGNISRIYIEKGNYIKALEFAENSLNVAQQTSDLQNIQNAYELLSLAYERLNNSVAALENYKKYTGIKDSLFNTEKYRSIKEIEAKYELEKKEQQVALLTEKNHVQLLTLSRRNRMIISSLGTIVLLIIIGYILIRINRLKSRQQAMELEQKLLRSQMNPHFIFNSLMAIQSYIYKNDPVQAGDFLAKFADLVRITLENSRVEFVLLENEIKMLRIYLELQALRFNNKFTHQINVAKTIDPQIIRLPPMLAQPFIENAIEHGLRHKPQGGFIKISFEMFDSHLVFSVEDNGIGREKARELEIDKKYKAMATSITKERLELLTRKMKQTYTLEYKDLKDMSGKAMGTLVKLKIPFQKIN